MPRYAIPGFSQGCMTVTQSAVDVFEHPNQSRYPGQNERALLGQVLLALKLSIRAARKLRMFSCVSKLYFRGHILVQYSDDLDEAIIANRVKD